MCVDDWMPVNGPAQQRSTEMTTGWVCLGDGSVFAGELYGGWKKLCRSWGSEVSLWLPELIGCVW